jgi:hypothetical protein
MLVLLSEAGLVNLRLVPHDETKIRSQEKLEAARRLVKEDPQGEGGGNQRQRAAQQRAAAAR